MGWFRSLCLAALCALPLLSGCDDGQENLPDGGAADASNPDDILVRLNAIPGLVATEPPAPQPPDRPIPPGYRFFTIDFDQPVDHAHPQGPHFSERFRLL